MARKHITVVQMAFTITVFRDTKCCNRTLRTAFAVIGPIFAVILIISICCVIAQRRRQRAVDKIVAQKMT